MVEREREWETVLLEKDERERLNGAREVNRIRS